MNTILSLYIFITGTILGSFYNVVGLRLPQNISFTNSRSACPQCSTTLQARDLIPLFSYLLSKGKCRHCQGKIPVAYPLVELITGGLFLYAYLTFGWSADLLGALLLLSLAVIVTVSDLKYMVIPDRLLLFFGAAFLGFRYIKPLDPWYSSVLGAVAGFVLIFLIILISRGGMGAGDMKLLGVLGILLGFKMTMLTFFLATLIGTCVSLILLSTGIIGRKDPFPFGPSIMAGAVISYFYGQDLLSFYMDHFFI
ncbi:prepilin peptidase [Halobacillus litoralis]|uniref:prepilin peptidase n=1 Tax=Halobacillus litoralis TaxID=45668 RepID=UPI001CFE7682|nr:A24 family peptidase [Halobacillus litoralis]